MAYQIHMKFNIIKFFESAILILEGKSLTPTGVELKVFKFGKLRYRKYINAYYFVFPHPILKKYVYP